MKKKMKAAMITESWGAEELKLETTEIPDLKEGEVLVRIKAAGVNPVDAYIVEGKYKDIIPHSLPLIPGWDLAGVVEERGHGARRFAVGDEVYSYARRPEVKWGTYAEYIVLPDSYLAKRPEKLSWEESAAIPLAGLTAYQSVYIAGELREGQQILILGASGGVGGFAIELARLKGAEVIGVASKENHDYMRDLGAHHTIDYKTEHIGDAAKSIFQDGVDLIFDCTGGESLEQGLRALKSSGKLVSIRTQGEELDPEIDFRYVFVEPDVSQLDHLREMANAGDLKVNINRTYSLNEAAEAIKKIATLHTTGKIVIVP